LLNLSFFPHLIFTSFLYVLLEKKGGNPFGRNHSGASLGFQPDWDLTLNGLIQGLKESCPEIHATILSTLMQALEERVIEDMLDTAPGRYVRDGHERRPRQLKCSLGTIHYRFAQLTDRQEKATVIPLKAALSMPSHDHTIWTKLWKPLLALRYMHPISEIECPGSIYEPQHSTQPSSGIC